MGQFPAISFTLFNQQTAKLGLFYTTKSNNSLKRNFYVKMVGKTIPEFWWTYYKKRVYIFVNFCCDSKLVNMTKHYQALPTVSPNGILMDVVKEVQTQLLSFCVTWIFKTLSTLNCRTRYFWYTDKFWLVNTFGTEKTKTNTTFTVVGKNKSHVWVGNCALTKFLFF